VIDPGGGTYVVEYRGAVGEDAWLASNWRGLRAGVLVRRDDPEGDPAQTLLLDASPSPAARFATDWDETVPLGGSLRSGDGRVVVRVEGETAAAAQLSIEIDGARPASGLARLGSRLADGSTSRVVRDPALTPVTSSTPPGTWAPDTEVTRRPFRTPAR
jgi:hypothetical protein